MGKGRVRAALRVVLCVVRESSSLGNSLGGREVNGTVYTERHNVAFADIPL
jgi:hypothetical protein